MGLPAWAYKIGTVGGIALLFQLLKPMFSHYRDMYFESHDRPVLAVLLQPKMKLDHWTGGVACYSRTEEIPHPMVDFTKTTHRSASSVEASLHRLEKRGKAVEHAAGWQRKC